MNRNGLPWIHGVQLDACGFISSGWLVGFATKLKVLTWRWWPRPADSLASIRVDSCQGVFATDLIATAVATVSNTLKLPICYNVICILHKSQQAIKQANKKTSKQTGKHPTNKPRKPKYPTTLRLWHTKKTVSSSRKLVDDCIGINTGRFRYSHSFVKVNVYGTSVARVIVATNSPKKHTIDRSADGPDYAAQKYSRLRSLGEYLMRGDKISKT